MSRTNKSKGHFITVSGHTKVRKLTVRRIFAIIPDSTRRYLQMLLTEYTAERKNILNKLNISHAEFPFGLRLLWCDSIGSAEAPQLITAQNHSHTFFEIELNL